MNMNKLKQAQKNPPLCKDESVTRGTTSFELPCISQFHSRSQTLKTAPLANGEAPVSFSFTDALRWVRQGTIYRLSLSRFAFWLYQGLLILINTLRMSRLMR